MDTGTTLQLVRAFKALPHEIWRAWTEPSMLARWWWPARFQTTYEVDLREGGSYRFRTAEIPGMGRLDLSGVFLEVRPEQALQYTWHWDGESLDTRVAVTFTRSDAGTDVSLTHEGFPSAEECANHVIGWNDCLDRLAELH